MANKQKPKKVDEKQVNYLKQEIKNLEKEEKKKIEEMKKDYQKRLFSLKQQIRKMYYQTGINKQNKGDCDHPVSHREPAGGHFCDICDSYLGCD